MEFKRVNGVVKFSKSLNVEAKEWIAYEVTFMFSKILYSCPCV